MKKILNIGSINIDYVYSVPHFVKSGETLAAASRQIFPGGKGMNQSIALARAGAEVSHAGMIGKDGEWLIKILQEAGVDTNLINQTDNPGGHTIIQVDERGENCILLFPGANRQLDEGFVSGVISQFSKGDILLLQNEVSCVAHAIKTAKAQGMSIAFNPSPYDAEIANYPLELVDWWLLNEVEGQAISKIDEPSKMLDTISKQYPNAGIVLTLGEDGVFCRHKGETYFNESYKAQVIDTTAAGDTFTGYFISAISKGQKIEEALYLASKAASIAVSRKGAAVSIPNLSEILKEN